MLHDMSSFVMKEQSCGRKKERSVVKFVLQKKFAYEVRHVLHLQARRHESSGMFPILSSFSFRKKISLISKDYLLHFISFCDLMTVFLNYFIFDFFVICLHFLKMSCQCIVYNLYVIYRRASFSSAEYVNALPLQMKRCHVD